MSIKFDCGAWDSWGFGFSYYHRGRVFTVNFIHWYFSVEVWRK